jgi:hypothetical protein
MITQPQTLYGIADSPVGNLTRDEVLDNVTYYWVTVAELHACPDKLLPASLPTLLDAIVTEPGGGHAGERGDIGRKIRNPGISGRDRDDGEDFTKFVPFLDTMSKSAVVGNRRRA